MSLAEKPVRVGQRVEILSKETYGVVAFIGNTHFSVGKWIGVILDQPKGKNNGIVQGKSYFQCDDNYGIFVRQTQLCVIDGDTEDDFTEMNTSTTSTPSIEKPKSRLPTFGRFSLGPLSFAPSSPKSPFPATGRSSLAPTQPRTPSQSSLVKTPTGSQTSLSKTPSISQTSLNKVSIYSQSSLNKTHSTSQTSLIKSDKVFKKPSITSSQKIAQKKADAKLPLGSVGKLTPSQQREEKSDISPRQDAKKARAFTETAFVETLTPQFTPGVPSPAMQTLEDRQNVAQAQQEIENLKAEIQDLNEKLETIRIKRAQDKDKLKDGDKLRLQVEQLLEFKSRIMESQASLQKDLAKARQEAKEAIEAREQLVEESQDLMDSVEMLTLDKEMAEEKAETVQLEYDQSKEKIEELMLDLEILRAEKEPDDLSSGESMDKLTSVQVKQYEQQNQRLHETLVRMRDIAAHDKHELQKMLKETEGHKSEIQDLNKNKEKLMNQINQLEETVSDLQEQVDAALGAEEMVETLTDRNLNLEERVAELLETVSDLEALNDMNDQLQENARDMELELREELDLTNAKIREDNCERDALNEVIVDRDNTIKKFRDLVQKLQDNNVDLRKSLQKESDKPIGSPSEIIDFKKMFSETKAHGKAIELELRSLEVQQAKEHVSYLIQFLPESFMARGGDHDAVLVLLLLPRLKAKCDILIGGLRDQYNNNLVETIDRNAVLKTHKVDQYSFAARMTHMLLMIQTFVNQCHYISNTCSVDIFLRMGTLYSDMLTQERHIDFYVDLLRKDQLDETVGCDYLEKAVSFFLTLYVTHFSDSKMDQGALLVGTSKALMAATDAIGTETSRIRTLLGPSESPGEVSDLCLTVGKMSNEVNSCVKRIKRRLPNDGSSGPVNYPQEVEDNLICMISDVNQVLSALRQTAKSAMQQTALIGDVEGGIPNAKLLELLHQATDLVYGSEDQGPKSITSTLEQSQERISKIAENMDKGEYDFDGTVEKEAIPPISLQAERLKAELKETEHLKYKLASKEVDVKELKIMQKQKNEELSQMAIRRDMAEKKLTTANRDADMTIEKLQRKLDDALMMLRRKEKEFEETMDHLQNDIENLEYEKGELREKLKTVNKRTLYEALSKNANVTGGLPLASPTTPLSHGISLSSSTGGGSIVTDSPMLLENINNLKNALSYANYEKNHYIQNDMKRKLASLRPLKLSTMNPVLSAIDPNQEVEIEEASQQRRDLTHRMNKLRKELLNLMTGPEIVDLSKKHNKENVGSAIDELINQREKISHVKRDMSQLQVEINRLVASRHPAGTISTSFATFTTPQFTKASCEKDLLKIGRITVPGVGNEKTKDPIKLLIKRPEDLKNLMKFFT